MSGGSAGVKNLRAMFENKNTSDQSTSPPSRGRSPSRSISSVNSRPVSIVRASFVAVERPGEGGQPSQWGLRKTSDVSSMAEVREEAIMQGANPTSNETSTPGPEGPGLGAILKGSPFEYAPGERPVQSTPTTKSKAQAPAQAGPAGKPQTNGNTNKVASMVGKMQPRDQPAANSEPGADKATKPARAVPAKEDTTTAASKSKDSPTVPKKSPLPQKKPQTSPTTTTGTDGTPAVSTNPGGFKPRGGVSKIQGIIASANKAKEERAKAEQLHPDSPQEEKKRSTPKEVKPPAVASKPTAASKAHAQKQEGQNAESLVKVSDAAKATKLPSAATAPTAASAARKDVKPEKEDSKKPATDRKSILPQAPRVANVTTKASLAKKSSRASLAGGEDRSKPRPSASYKPADEGFLARMTRPTASSAQKAHGKLEVTSPPRPRQSSASHQAPKKQPPRKSVSTVTKEQTVAKPAATEDNEETALDRVQEDTAQAQGPEHNEQSDGEPGPAEETDMPSQQAEVSIVGA